MMRRCSGRSSARGATAARCGPFSVTLPLGAPNADLGAEGRLRLGIARALVKIDPEHKPKLKAEELMTRNPREVERKKFGRKKARKRYQFSKR